LPSGIIPVTATQAGKDTSPATQPTLSLPARRKSPNQDPAPALVNGDPPLPPTPAASEKEEKVVRGAGEINSSSGAEMVSPEPAGEAPESGTGSSLMGWALVGIHEGIRGQLDEDKTKTELEKQKNLAKNKGEAADSSEKQAEKAVQELANAEKKSRQDGQPSNSEAAPAAPGLTLQPGNNSGSPKTEGDGEGPPPAPALMVSGSATGPVKAGEKLAPKNGKANDPVGQISGAVAGDPKKTIAVGSATVPVKEAIVPNKQEPASASKGSEGPTPTLASDANRSPPPPINITQPGKELPVGIQVPVPPDGADPKKSSPALVSKTKPTAGKEPVKVGSPELLPVGAEPFVKTPPIHFSGRGGGEKTGGGSVQKFEAEALDLREAVTWAALSKTRYGSEKYGAALEEFNRTYRQDPPLNPGEPKPGRRVYLPPLGYLEKNYAQLLAPHERVQANSQPMLVSTPFTDATAGASGNKRADGHVVPAAWTQPPGTRTYRVRGQNQYLLLIARKTLGDEKRWPEIYHLNPKIRPENPVPEGTDLTLPGDARVEPAGKP
jgi:hypothetical protein